MKLWNFEWTLSFATEYQAVAQIAGRATFLCLILPSIHPLSLHIVTVVTATFLGLFAVTFPHLQDRVALYQCLPAGVAYWFAEYGVVFRFLVELDVVGVEWFAHLDLMPH